MNHVRRCFAILGALLFSVGIAFTVGQAAHANPVGVGIVHNTQGEAGYYANSNGQTRFRDVQAQVTVTNAIKNLNGSGCTSVSCTNPGAVGVELCDPNTDYSVQLGVLWDGNSFDVQYGHGLLGAPIGGNDPCIQSGLVDGLHGGHLHFMNSFAPAAGDQLKFEIYYDPHSHWINATACDLTQDVCRNAHFNDGYKNLYEFGIGAVSNANVLTAPANNPLVSFSHTAANYYSSTKFWGSIFVSGHWNLKQADFVNSSDQVVLSSNGSLNNSGTAFNLLNGSTSA